MREATAFWVEEPGSGALRQEALRAPGAGEALVRTLWTGVSRGTEATVFGGRVPVGERERMRAPFQEGDFPAPVKYGYLNVGVVEEGPPELAGRTVFTLFPHQSAFVVPASAVLPVPEGVPARRAVLAGAVETAVNVLWDAAPLVGDRVAVIGAGMIGCCVARLAAGLPGAEVTLVDREPGRAAVAEQLGVAFADPDAAPRDADLVIHTSGSEAGLRLALETVVTEGVVVEASWYGDREVALPLGADFHSRRLMIRSSQVGAVSPARRDRRTTSDRLGLALRLLRDPAFDALLTGASAWRELPEVLARLAASPGAELCHTIDWRDA
ncbi:zinc-binding alcohol dehydrogenase [Leifsonia sp. F6_8S_P_1B]|uniref:Zinc-binding alcohol dehydrogenase n=1 Tax=Leifsonia williamsii TaxID=3035919 RepID=A0ABT8K9P4_9MICO|nr:zinc-binding alcohol dehydrogenase [Leifsonia williamsii]MDN4613887.1 zinc-binding alcohol dehydrogenase [Leifsonia williamsii]